MVEKVITDPERVIVRDRTFPWNVRGSSLYLVQSWIFLR